MLQSHASIRNNIVKRSNNVLLFLLLLTYICTLKIRGVKMAKQQTFADKAKAKKKDSGVSVKLIKSVKSSKGTFKFNERFVKLDDISKVSDIK